MAGRGSRPGGGRAGRVVGDAARYGGAHGRPAKSRGDGSAQVSTRGARNCPTRVRGQTRPAAPAATGTRPWRPTAARPARAAPAPFGRGHSCCQNRCCAAASSRWHMLRPSADARSAPDCPGGRVLHVAANSSTAAAASAGRRFRSWVMRAAAL